VRSCDDFRYNLYYCPSLELSLLPTWKNPPTKKRDSFVEIMVESIRRHGLRNPPFCSRRGSRWEIRPGKARVHACRALGWTHIPAFIADYDLARPPSDWELLPYDAEALTKRFYSIDCVVELSRRFASVKKTISTIYQMGQVPKFVSVLSNSPTNP
jgi:hypothetical protein